MTSALTASISGPGAAAYFIAAGDDGCTGRSLGLSDKNRSCTIKVTFAPASAGTFAATLKISVAQPKASLSVSLSGVGESPANDFYRLTVTVFTDSDLSGTKGDTETGLPGVIVRLISPSGIVMATWCVPGRRRSAMLVAQADLISA